MLHLVSHLATVLLHCPPSFYECLEELALCLEAARGEDSEVAHNVVWGSLILEGLERERGEGRRSRERGESYWEWGIVFPTKAILIRSCTFVRVSTVVLDFVVWSSTSTNWRAPSTELPVVGGGRRGRRTHCVVEVFQSEWRIAHGQKSIFLFVYSITEPEEKTQKIDMHVYHIINNITISSWDCCKFDHRYYTLRKRFKRYSIYDLTLLIACGASSFLLSVSFLFSWFVIHCEHDCSCILLHTITILSTSCIIWPCITDLGRSDLSCNKLSM